MLIKVYTSDSLVLLVSELLRKLVTLYLAKEFFNVYYKNTVYNSNVILP